MNSNQLKTCKWVITLPFFHERMKKSYNENKDEDKKLGGNIFKRQETKSPKKKKG